MGGAMLHRWIDSGVVAIGDVTVIDPGTPTVPVGVRVLPDAGNAGSSPRIIVLAIKPQQLDAAADALLGAMSGQPALLVSILAGVEEATLQARFRADAVVRAAPNLPVAIGKGAVALHGSGDVDRWRNRVDALMRPLGLVEWLAEERHLDVVTALGGSGPAFLYRFVDALAAAGAGLGLPEDQAARLALATVEGAAMLAGRADEPPRALADRVASPGGSTREGLNVLDCDGALDSLIAETLATAVRRNIEMAADARR